MRPARRLLLLLLGVLCRSGYADDTTTSVATVRVSTSLATTTSASQSLGATEATVTTAATPGTPTTPVTTTLSPQTAASSVPTTTPKETTPSQGSSTDSASAPAGSSLGATTAKPASSVRTSTSAAAAATTPGPASPPASGVTTTQPPPALSPTSAAVSTAGTTSAASTSPGSVATPSLVQKPTNVTAATSPAVAPSQGHAGVTQASTTVSQDSVTTANAQSAGSPRGSTTPAAGQPTPSKDTLATTATKPEGTPGTTVRQSSHAGSQATSSSPGVSVSMTTIKVPPAQHNPPADEGNRTWFLAQIQIMCESAIPSEKKAVILTLNESTPCDDLTKSSVADPLLNMLCKTMKPNFNRSQDQCVVRLAPVAGNPKDLAIIGVSVQIHAVADELYESLKIKQAELEKLGVKNITYDGQITTVDTEDRFSMPLIITIVCMAASLLLVAAIYGCCHQRIAQRKDQQRLTEELQTMENGYHDNPTLEVMETSSEMQEKKVNLNGELGDSWIVPMDNLTKEDLEEEEDTHL